MKRALIGCRLHWFVPMLLLLTSACFAQTPDLDQLLQIGVPSNSSTLAVPMGIVNLSNGNLHLEIPLKTVPQAGSLPPLTVSLVYDSQFWMQFSTPYVDLWTPSPTMGNDWRLRISPSASYVIEQEVDVIDTFPSCNPTGESTVPSWTNFSYSEPSGTTHVFPEISLQQSSPCSEPTGVLYFGQYAPDNSGYFMYVTSDILSGLGAGKIQVWDPHGNKVYDSNPLFGGDGGYLDSNGNVPIDNFATLDGWKWTLPGVTQSPITYYVNTHFNSTNSVAAQEYNYTLSSLGSLTLADGSTYSFGYDQCPGSSPCGNTDYHYGQLTKMTLPTGATVTFNYQTIDAPAHFEYDVSDLRVTSVSLSGDSLLNCADPTTWSGQTWSLCYHLSPADLAPGLFYTSGVDIVLPPDIGGVKNQISYVGGGQTRSGLTPFLFVPTAKSVHQGTGQGAPVLRSDSISYDTVGRINEIATHIDGVFAADTQYGYWAPHLPMISSKKEVDSSGNILRETDATYTSSYTPPLDCGSCTTFPHFIDRPLTTTLFGVGGAAGSAAASSQTLYYYDQYSLSTLAGTSGQSVLGLGTHDDTNFGAAQNIRGNLTSVSRMVSPGQFITTQMNNYNILGQIVSSTDGNGNVTKFDYYSSGWGDSSCAASTTYSYRANVTDALGHQTHATYNSCDGTTHSVQDQNDINAARTGTVYAYDPTERVIQINFPDGGLTVNYYPDPNHSSSSTSMDATRSLTTSTQVDSLGRVARTVAANGMIIDTTHDAFGQIASVTNPYRTTPLPGDPPFGLTSYRYDALGRKLLQCQPDNGNNIPCQPGVSYLKWSYAGNVTSSYDETRNSWQHTSDGLGRLTNVLEPNGASTGYTYDARNNLSTVTQPGLSGETPRTTRTFFYDSLSRLTSTTNPETGTIGYAYLLNGGGFCAGDVSLPCSKTDALGTTANYTYDALNRISAKNYLNDPNTTPSTCFLYDTNGTNTPANAIGRLTAEWTQNGACPENATSLPASGFLTAKTVSSYDPMGRLLAQQTCVFTNCTLNSYRPQSFTHDLAGNLTGFSDGWGLQTFGQIYDAAGRLQFLTSSWSDPTHPPMLYGVQNYGPIGVLNATMGEHLTITKAYDSRERITSMTVQGVH